VTINLRVEKEKTSAQLTRRPHGGVSSSAVVARLALAW